MQEEIKTAIEDFSKGNKDLAKILSLFSAKIILILGRYFLSIINVGVTEATDSLQAYFDNNGIK